MSRCLALSLVDDQYNWAGLVRVNASKDENRDEYEEGSAVELIELSRGEVRDYHDEHDVFEEWYETGCPRDQQIGLYRFYNVMWVEWVDQIAYRKAIGRVPESVWDRVTHDRVDVVLG